ncbi:MAG: hypothetical protein HY731_02735 [Candidatus Tectomicrobia bacterium]|nr:hypothetical protein [Candidatus Tectomicrobia bacterium]
MAEKKIACRRQSKTTADFSFFETKKGYTAPVLISALLKPVINSGS